MRAILKCYEVRMDLLASPFFSRARTPIAGHMFIVREYDSVRGG